MPTFRTLDQVVADSLDRPRLFAAVLTFFSAVALTLAAVGAFGVLSLAVAQRTREICVRMALGASPRTVVKAIVGEALMFAAIGLAAGIAGAIVFARWLPSELFNVQPTDAATLTGVVLTPGGTALLASLLPAWRAATVDPLATLRTG